MNDGIGLPFVLQVLYIWRVQNLFFSPIIGSRLHLNFRRFMVYETRRWTESSRWIFGFGSYNERVSICLYLLEFFLLKYGHFVWQVKIVDKGW